MHLYLGRFSEAKIGPSSDTRGHHLDKVFEGLFCKTWNDWQRCGCLFEITHCKCTKVGLSETSAHHSFGPSSRLLNREGENTPVRGDKNTHFSLSKMLSISLSLRGASVMSICGFYGLFWCNEKPEKYCPFVFVFSVLEWILEWMGWSSQRIKVKQFDLYFKGHDYSGARLTDSRE